MIGKRLRRIIRQLLLIFCILNKKKYVQLISQKIIRTVKKKHKKTNSIRVSKRRKRRLALSCGKETIYIIKRNNNKTPW